MSKYFLIPYFPIYLHHLINPLLYANEMKLAEFLHYILGI